MKKSLNNFGIVMTKTPFRISLFGGGTDIPLFFNKHSGSVLGFTINKYIYVVVNVLKRIQEKKIKISYSKLELVNNINDIDHPIVREVLNKYYRIQNNFIDIHSFADFPKESGLASSSAFCVGFIKSIYDLNNKKITKKLLAQKSIEIERNILGEKGGWQDQIHCSFGGINKIKFKKNNFKINKINVSKKRVNELESSMLLIYSGQSRSSSMIHKKLYKENTYTNSKNVKILKKMNKMVDEAEHILKFSKIANLSHDLGKLLDKNWQYKKSLNRIISNNKINMIYNKLINSGAYGGKLLGAGNNGFLLIIFDKKRLADIKKIIKNYKYFSFNLEYDGAKTFIQE